MTLMTLRSDEVVQLAYHLLLNRDPEEAGLQHWSSALDQGLSRVDFVRAVLASPEFQQQLAFTDVAAYHDVDLVVPIAGLQFRVPASDVSLVPHLLARRCWEPHVTRYLERELQPAHVFLDVGANLGYFTVRLARKVARVVAFEPGPANHAYCAGNVALNGLENVELHAVGLWHEDTTLQLRTDSSCVGMATVAPTGGHADTIRVAPLDSLVAGGEVTLPRLDMIKMDIEGAELAALSGMRDTLARHRPRIVMEINRPALAACGASADEVWSFLTSRGYRILAFEHWKETDPAPVGSVDDLKRLCPSDSLIDIVAIPGEA